MDFLFGTSAEYLNDNKKDDKRELVSNLVIGFIVIRGVIETVINVIDDVKSAKEMAEYRKQHPSGPSITGETELIDDLKLSQENYDLLKEEYNYRVSKILESGLLNENITDDIHVVELALHDGGPIKHYQYSVFFTLYNFNYLEEWFKMKKSNDRRQTIVFSIPREVFDTQLSDIKDDYIKQKNTIGLNAIIEDNRPYKKDIDISKKIPINQRFKKPKKNRFLSKKDNDTPLDENDDWIPAYEQFLAEQYDEELSADLMYLCKKVYETNNFDNMFDDYMHLSHDGESNGIISYDKTNSEIIICFKGSETRNDWMHNFNTLSTDINSKMPETEALPDAFDDVRVHKGIYDLCMESYQQIIHKFGAERLTEVDNVYVCGHSQGGVESLICSYLLQAGGYCYPTVYTYASPQAFYGSTTFDDIDTMNIYNIQHNLDLVPLLPQKYDPIVNIHGWHHVGTIIVYDATNDKGSYQFNVKYDIPVNGIEWNKEYRQLHGAEYYLSLLSGVEPFDEDHEHFTNYIDAVQMSYIIKNFTALNPIGLVNYDEQTLPSYIVY